VNATVDLHSSDMFQAQNRETKLLCPSYHYDDERYKIMFHKITPELQDQDQDRSVQDQDQDWFIWSETGLVLRPTVSDHITAAAAGCDVPCHRVVSRAYRISSSRSDGGKVAD